MRIIVLFVISLGISACSSTSGLSKKQFSNDIFTIYGVEGCKESNTGDDVDSKIGVVTCKDLTFSYDWGRYGFRGPRMPEEAFRQSFDIYHFTKFFELTHIDPKVQKLFRDSVAIINVGPIEEVKESMLFDCETCNAVAKLTFKGNTYYYPTTMNEASLQRPEGVETYEIEHQRTKLFTTSNDYPGAVIKKTVHKRKDNYLSVAITEHKMSDKKVFKLLKSIRLENPTK